MRRTLVKIAVAAALLPIVLPAHALVTSIDDLLVKRDGGNYFHDTFGDGIAPPVAEANTGVCGALAPACYAVFGPFAANAESGGKLRFDTAAGLPSEAADGTDVVTQRIRLLTNRDDTQPTTGLKIGHTFSAAALFDLSVPGPGDSYTLRFEDLHLNDPEPDSRNDFLQFQVRMGTLSGAVPVIALRKQNFIDGTIDVIASTPLDLDLEADQIRLTLDHKVANSTEVFASWEYLLSGNVVGSGSFETPGTIFTGENFTRVAVLVSTVTPVPEPSSYATMLVGLGLLGWRLRGSSKVDRSS